jgi:hypothetical protein
MRNILRELIGTLPLMALGALTTWALLAPDPALQETGRKAATVAAAADLAQQRECASNILRHLSNAPTGEQIDAAYHDCE